jgi:hypothetical protein
MFKVFFLKNSKSAQIVQGPVLFVNCLGLNHQGGQRYRQDASGGLAEPPSK